MHGACSRVWFARIICLPCAPHTPLSTSTTTITAFSRMNLYDGVLTWVCLVSTHGFSFLFFLFYFYLNLHGCYPCQGSNFWNEGLRVLFVSRLVKKDCRLMAFSAPDFQFSIPSVSPFIWPDSPLPCFDRAGALAFHCGETERLKREIHYILFRSSEGRQAKAGEGRTKNKV